MPGKLAKPEIIFSHMKHLLHPCGLFLCMSITKKIAIGLGLASGALLAAWMLTGDRKKKTREFLTKKATDLKRALRSKQHQATDEDAIYI
jgi:hypothetical protein